MRAVLAVFVLVVSACGGSQDYRSPTAPPVPPPTLQPLPTQANRTRTSTGLQRRHPKMVT